MCGAKPNRASFPLILLFLQSHKPGSLAGILGGWGQVVVERLPASSRLVPQKRIDSTMLLLQFRLHWTTGE